MPHRGLPLAGRDLNSHPMGQDEGPAHEVGQEPGEWYDEATLVGTKVTKTPTPVR